MGTKEESCYHHKFGSLLVNFTCEHIADAFAYREGYSSRMLHHISFLLERRNASPPSVRPIERSAAINTMENCTWPVMGRELYSVRKGWKTKNEWTERWTPDSRISYERKRGLQPPAWNSSACLARWRVPHQQTENDPKGYLVLVNAR